MAKRDVLKRQQKNQQDQMQRRKLTAIAFNHLTCLKTMAKRDILEHHQTSQQQQMQCSVEMELRHPQARHQLLERGSQANHQQSNCMCLMSITICIQA